VPRGNSHRADEIVAAIGTEPPPVGGHLAAARLAGGTGLDVQKPDAEALAAAGPLMAAGRYKDWPLYRAGTWTRSARIRSLRS